MRRSRETWTPAAWALCLCALLLGAPLTFLSAVPGLQDASVRVYSREDIERLPSTLNLWEFLGHTEVSLTPERFDISGMHSGEVMAFGSRGGSWSQNRVVWNGFNLTSGDGRRTLLIPDLSAAERLVHDADSSRISPSGAILSVEPSSGGSTVHGQVQLFFQAGALQNVNVTPRLRSFGITESDERNRHSAHANAQVGGPLSTNWTYYGSLTRLQMEKWIRNLSLPVRGTLTSAMVRLSGDLSGEDRLRLDWLAQRGHQPQEGATPQVALEATRDSLRTFQSLQGSWTRTSSSGNVLDLRAAASLGRVDADFQPGVAEPSREERFPGSIDITYVPSAEEGKQIVALLYPVRSGSAPLAFAVVDQSLEVRTYLEILRDGPGALAHRVVFGGGFERLRVREQAHALDGYHLRFFRDAAESVQRIDPSDARNGAMVVETYAEDTVQAGALTVTLTGQLSARRGSSREAVGPGSNDLRWLSIGAHAGIAYTVGRAYPLVLRASAARRPQESLLRALEAADPAGLGVSTYLWEDSNLDGVFQPAEVGALTRLEGSRFTTLDPGLKPPHTRESRLEAVQTLPAGLALGLAAFRREEVDLLALVDIGVPASAFAPVAVFDPGDDGASQTGDETFRVAYNQDPATLGRDAYLLTNPSEASAFSEGYEARLTGRGSGVQWELAFTRYRAVALTAPGNDPWENDWGRLPVVNDPNQSINAYGSTFFDRGLGARFWGSWDAGWASRLSWRVSYLDGVPYGRVLPVTGLNQGLTGILATRRGPGDGSPGGGKRTSYNLTADFRFSRGFDLGGGQLETVLDVFNLLNMSKSLEESDVTSPTHLWRIPLRFQTPRSLQMGLRFGW